MNKLGTERAGRREYYFVGSNPNFDSLYNTERIDNEGVNRTNII